jgi:hypothetical protein
VYDGSRLKVDYVKVDGKWLDGVVAPSPMLGEQLRKRASRNVTRLVESRR